MCYGDGIGNIVTVHSTLLLIPQIRALSKIIIYIFICIMHFRPIKPGDCSSAESIASAACSWNTPPSPSSVHDQKLVGLDSSLEGCKQIPDDRTWTSLHREAADSRHLGLTPPQGLYASSVRYPDINVRGPGGLTPLHVAVCRSTDFRDSYHDDDKDSEDSAEGSVVSSFLFLKLIP